MMMPTCNFEVCVFDSKVVLVSRIRLAYSSKCQFSKNFIV